LLFPAADFVILTEPLQPRAISAPLLAEMTAHLAKNSAVVRNPIEALERAVEMASPEDAVFATGSLYLVGDLRSYWHKRSGSKIAPSVLSSAPNPSLRKR
jgi:dihydrofolate synthase/folylpolyglutamate synthase